MSMEAVSLANIRARTKLLFTQWTELYTHISHMAEYPSK